jgi:hypothetical protein
LSDADIAELKARNVVAGPSFPDGSEDPGRRSADW